MASLTFLSWNVNGLRAVLKTTFRSFLEEHGADFYAFQEIKARPDQLEGVWEPPPGYTAFWNPASKPGYAGTLILSRHRPVAAETTMGLPEADREGRMVALEFANFFLVNLYVPNSQRGLTRLDFRVREWEPALRQYLAGLTKQKHVVVCGDFNVAHKEIDLARPKDNRRNAGFTDEERGAFSQLLEVGFRDTFRERTEEGGHYTWWSYMNQARPRNIGWRIDYWLATNDLQKAEERAWILPERMGSDHCPVGLTMKRGRWGLVV